MISCSTSSNNCLLKNILHDRTKSKHATNNCVRLGKCHIDSLFAVVPLRTLQLAEHYSPAAMLVVPIRMGIASLCAHKLKIDQFRYIKIQPKATDLSTKLWGIDFVEFIPQSPVLSWIFMIYRNWSI